MRTLRVAAVACGVGLGLFAVGCGPTPTTGGGGTGSGGTGKGGQPTGKGDPAKDSGDKAKVAAGEINKRLDPLMASLDKLKAKLAADEKTVGEDADKVLAVVKLRDAKNEAESLVKQINDKVATFKDAKDAAALDAAKLSANVLLDKLEPLLKDSK
jgi:hypothetical protein